MSDDSTFDAPIDADELGNSLTGYDEIAIEQMFHKDISGMGAGTTAMRALLFVAMRREGMTDVDAFRNVMLMPLADVLARFKDVNSTQVGDEGKA